MKSDLLKIKEEEGYEKYFEGIRNTIAGCRIKWKTLPKVVDAEMQKFEIDFVQEIKQEFSKKAINNQAVLVPASASAPCDDTSVTPNSANDNYFAFKKRRFRIL